MQRTRTQLHKLGRIKRVLKLYPRTGSALEPFVATASHRWRVGNDQVWRWWRVRRQGLQLWLHVPKRARRLRSGCLSHPVCTSRRGRVVGRARSGCLGRRNPGRHSRRRRCRRRCRRCSAIRRRQWREPEASSERLLVLVAWCGRRRSVAQRRSRGWLMLSAVTMRLPCRRQSQPLRLAASPRLIPCGVARSRRWRHRVSARSGIA